MYVCMYVCTYGSGRKVGRLHLERLMRQRHLPTLGLSWSHLPTLGPGIWTGSCGNGIFQLSVCGKRLQYCKKRETAITTTAPVLQRERESNCNSYNGCSIAERQRETAITTTAPVLQIGRNCKYFDRSGIAEKKTCNYYDRSSIAEREREREKERETALTTTAPVLQRERNCDYGDPSSMANREKLQALRPLQCCRNRETATATTAPNQKLEGCKLGRIQSWKMCFIPTVGCWNLGCASSNFAAATICMYVCMYVCSMYMYMCHLRIAYQYIYSIEGSTCSRRTDGWMKGFPVPQVTEGGSWGSTPGKVNKILYTSLEGEKGVQGRP